MKGKYIGGMSVLGSDEDEPFTAKWVLQAAVASVVLCVIVVAVVTLAAVWQASYAL